LFFAKQDDFGNFHFTLKSKVISQNPKVLILLWFSLLNFAFFETPNNKLFI